MGKPTKKQVQTEATRLSGIYAGILRTARTEKSPQAYAAAAWASAILSAWVATYNKPKSSGYASRAGQRQARERQALHGSRPATDLHQLSWSP